MGNPLFYQGNVRAWANGLVNTLLRFHPLVLSAFAANRGLRAALSMSPRYGDHHDYADSDAPHLRVYLLAKQKVRKNKR